MRKICLKRKQKYPTFNQEKDYFCSICEVTKALSFVITTGLMQKLRILMCISIEYGGLHHSSNLM